MATAASPQLPQQLWLDVARPIIPRPRKVSPDAPGTSPKPSIGHHQLELRMVASPFPGAVSVPVVPVASLERPSKPERPSFAALLLGQGKRPGTLGELAKAAKQDRLFPARGSADDVRARFSAVGADGDAFEALEDAEREYDRQAS